MDSFPLLDDFLEARSNEYALRAVVERAIKAMAELQKENDRLRGETNEMLFQIDTEPKEDSDVQGVPHDGIDEGGGSSGKIIFVRSEGLNALNMDNHSQDPATMVNGEEENGNKKS